MKFVCDDRIPFLRGVLEPFADVQYIPGPDTTPAVVRDAVALVTRTRTICDSELLNGSSVRAIASATIGYDHIDTRWCEAHGISWANAPGCNSSSVVQYVASVLVTLSRRHGFCLEGRTLGIVGVGNVGSRLARLAEILGMRLLLCDPPRSRREIGGGFVSLDEIIKASDIISLHVPLSKDGPDATWHLFDAERIASMRETQFLINSSRGPVVDNAALLEALRCQRIAGAVLDVWEDEPHVNAELAGMLDIATPHIAGYSADGKAAGTTAAVRMLAREFDLPLQDWCPAELPAPARKFGFDLNVSGKSVEEALGDAILYSYDVQQDSSALLSDLGAFEHLRGHYPVRREFPAFTINLSSGDDVMAGKLSSLGFKLA